MRPIVVWKNHKSMPSIFAKEIKRVRKPAGAGDLLFCYLVPTEMEMSDAAIGLAGVPGERVHYGVAPGIITFVFSKYTGKA